jgi:hypothetical protein
MDASEQENPGTTSSPSAVTPPGRFTNNEHASDQLRALVGDAQVQQVIRGHEGVS